VEELGLDFDEDAFAPEEPVGEEADGDKSEGEGHGCVLCAPVEGEEVMVGPEPCGDVFSVGSDGSGDFDPDQVFYDELGDAEGDDGVGAEDEPGPDEPFACFCLVEMADVDEPVAGGEADERAAGGNEDVGAGPEVFVDGKPEIPEETGGEAEKTGEEKADGALRLGDGGGFAICAAKPKCRYRA
jgi:hypothetical protein